MPPDNQTLTPRQIQQNQVIMSWRATGIPHDYCDPEKGLGHYGAVPGHRFQARAERLADMFKVNPQTSQMERHVHAGIGLTFLDSEEDLFALTARSVSAQCRVPTKYVDLSIINNPRNTSFFMDCGKEIKAVFIRGFFVKHFAAAFTDTERYNMEMNLRWVWDRGVTLFIQVEVPLVQCTWWSPAFLNLLAKKSPIFA